MKFEVGKFYEHKSGYQLAIICEANTTNFGNTLLAEQNNSMDFVAVGSDESATINYKEISIEEWIKNFSSNKAVADKWIEKFLLGNNIFDKESADDPVTSGFICKQCGIFINTEKCIINENDFDNLCPKCWSLKHPVIDKEDFIKKLVIETELDTSEATYLVNSIDEHGNINNAIKIYEDNGYFELMAYSMLLKH